MKQIVPGLYTLSGMRMGRVYAIDDPDGLTIIDTALASSVPAILKQVTEAGKPVKRILITHAHPDHIGGLPKLQAQVNAEVITGEIERPFVEGKLPIPRSTNSRLPMPEQTMPGTPVNRVVKDGDIISDIFGGLHVVFTPGHSTGHLSFWQPDKHILITGDTMMHLFGKIRLPIAQFTVDMDENKRSIAKVVKLNPQVVCFGHGEPITTGAAEALQSFARRVGVPTT